MIKEEHIMICDIYATISEFEKKYEATILEILGKDAYADEGKIVISDLLYGNTEDEIINVIKQLVKSIPELEFHMYVHESGTYNRTAYKIDVKKGNVDWVWGIGAAEDILECPKCGCTKSVDKENLSFEEWEDMMFGENIEALVRQFAGPFEEITCPECGKLLNPIYVEKQFKI